MTSTGAPICLGIRRRWVAVVSVALMIGLLGSFPWARKASAGPDRANRRPSVKVASGELAGVVQRFVDAIPRARTEGYDVPTEEERSAMAEAYGYLEAGELGKAAALVRPLGYDVYDYTDTATGRRFAILLERRSSSGAWPHAWGLYVYSAQATSDMIVEVPHPVADLYTEKFGSETFMMANARALFIAGAHRNADANGAADVAHREDSIFQAIHRAALASSSVVFQPHGFNADGSDLGDIVVSSGSAPASGLATDVAVGSRERGFTVCLYDGTACKALAATTNVQGISARLAGVQFLHEELSLDIRQSAASRATLIPVVVSAVG